MDCPHCSSHDTYEHSQRTILNYKQYRCRACKRQYNERTGTAHNHLHYPTDIVLLAVFYYYRFKNSLVDVTKHMALRGFNICHETIRLWSQTFGTEVGIKFRNRRVGKSCGKIHIDATYIKVQGHWYYLYRAIDKYGELVDVYLSDTRDIKAAERFFRNCKIMMDGALEQITTDKEPALYAAIENCFGPQTKHRDSKYKNNIIESNHRMIKSRIRSMKGFKSPWCAMIFCTVFEEIAQFFRAKNKTLAQQRKIFMPKFNEFLAAA